MAATAVMRVRSFMGSPDKRLERNINGNDSSCSAREVRQCRASRLSLLCCHHDMELDLHVVGYHGSILPLAIADIEDRALDRQHAIEHLGTAFLAIDCRHHDVLGLA